MTRMRCDDCGKFISKAKSWANVYDMTGGGLDHEHFRCVSCFEKFGAVHSNARPHDGNMLPYEGVTP